MAATDLKTLKAKRASLKAYLTRTSNFLKSLSSPNLTDLKVRYAKLFPYLESFEDVQLNIEILEELEPQEEERTEFESTYLSLICQIQDLIDDLESKKVLSQSNESKKASVKLPTIKLPTFTGLYEEWLPFHDTFNSLIHSENSIPDIQKFHYLKSALDGEAAAILHSLPLSAENYTVAWDMLKSRYDNRRLIIQQHIKSMHDLPTLNRENSIGLRQILDGIQKHTRALKSLGRPVDQWDDLLLYLIVIKLDTITNKEWENSLPCASTIPTLQQMTAFLDKKCQTLENLRQKSQPAGTDTIKSKSLKSSSHVSTSYITCPICSQKHFAYQCEKLLQQSVDERIKNAKSKGLCLNCLSSKHRTSDCKSSSCKTCKKRHHTLLHLEKETNVQPPTQTPASTSTNHSADIYNQSESLLSTALILVRDVKGQSHECRVLLDCGSQSNFITKSLANRLGIKQDVFSIPVLGLNQSSTQIHKSVQVQIKSRMNNFQSNIKCLVIDRITTNLPIISISASSFNIPKHIKLADPHFHISKPIDMLIGVDLFWKLLCVGQVKSNSSQPLLQKTHFGWIVAGTTNSHVATEQQTICNLITNEDLDRRLTTFWEVEQVGPRQNYTQEEKMCENHFQSNTTRNEHGRFVVKLPFKEAPDHLGDSYSSAIKRLYSLEKRFKADSSLKAQYVQFMEEYINLGHMKLTNISASEENSSSFYLPHHAVVKPDSTTTKLRVVFDGSCKTCTGRSLNDILMVGPTIQEDLFSIVNRFRLHQIALTADIAKMYRQVLVSSDDTKYQRILWRANTNHKIQIFNLSTVTYGTASASFLAIRSLQQLAIEGKEDFPIGSKIALRDFYVDDLITGANTVSEANTIIKQTTNLLQCGGFELRKWNSNYSGMFDDFDNRNSETIHTISSTNDIKALGLSWNTKDDTLFYDFPTSCANVKITKRYILSYISQMFDPLGLLGPAIVIGKWFIQKLWQLKLDWDETVPFDIHTEFCTFREQVAELKTFRIPRKVIPWNDVNAVDLHGFCDASTNAYGACIYLRSTNKIGEVAVNLICAKSKIAPVKATTIPRLELCGALLLSQLMEKVRKALHININRTTYWTDSTIVLSWITATSRQWKTFVANRVSEIQETTDINHWYHVRSEDNPADIISRGSTPSDLINSQLWWHGPPWLLSEEIIYDNYIVLSTNEHLPEEKVIKSCHIMASPGLNDLISRFSCFSKLLRITGLCMRFINNIKSRVARTHDRINIGTLSAIELRSACHRLVKLVQEEEFPQEIANLSKLGVVNKKSRTLSLNPFIDKDGIVRVGGRIQKANLPYSHKHPILLPAKHTFTKLIIEHFHKKHMHAGIQGTIAAIRTQYWPLSLRNSVKLIIRKCVTCFKVKPTSSDYLMGDLPKTRVEQARPFVNSGVDFCGPFLIKETRKRGSKSYKIHVAVFVCFATKAVHIELVNDLTSEAFINALKRFMARRGLISNLYSDNGTNFVGANNEIKKLYATIISEEHRTAVNNTFSQDGMQWHFIPPRSPHFGGLWEAAVKSLKHHLRRVVGNAMLTFEQLHTLLLQIESILNSRPLMPISDDPNDVTFLTPAHFLIGDSLTTIPEHNVLHINQNRLSYWQRVESLKQHFWKRWQREYLSSLQQRSKWKHSTQGTLIPGQLVIIKEDNLPPLKWAVGRIEAIHPGADSVVRTVSVRVKGDIVKRPVSKLCVLPLS